MPFRVFEVPLRQSGLLSPLMNDYLFECEKVSNLFAHQPNISSFADAIEERRQHHTNRVVLVETLEQQYAAFPKQKIVADNIALLRSENTFTVTVAHQPSLLLQPAYYAHKIASVIALANQLNATYTGYNFIPVFWLGSEDHDFDELGRAKIFDKEIVWKSNCSGALGRYTLDGLDEVRNEINALMQGADFLKLFDEALQRCNTFGELTRFLIHRLFGKYGLVIVDQDAVAFKRIFTGVIERELRESIAEQALQTTNDFLNAHYKAQASPRSINFFYLRENYRVRITRNAAGGFSTADEQFHFTADEMMSELQQHPERFSPNVIYRPLFQEMVLPNLAFVGGGAECSYWLQLKNLFTHFHVPYPVVLHRKPMAYLPASAMKKITKLGLDVASIFQNKDVFINDYVKANTDEQFNFSEVQHDFIKAFEKVMQASEHIDPTLKQSVAAEQQKLLNALTQLEGKFLKATKRKNENVVTQLQAVHECVFPNGFFQERAESFLPMLAHQDFLDTLIQHANPLDKTVGLIAETKVE